MTPYWIHFAGRSAACVEADSEAKATEIAETLTGNKVTSCRILPYPANPRIGEQSGCPPFCYRPEQCAGRTSCPRCPACSE
jgi:hypothetical protein